MFPVFPFGKPDAAYALEASSAQQADIPAIINQRRV